METAFGPALKEWRNRRGVSQLDLGSLSGVSAEHISFLETGRSMPSREMVHHLSEFLEVPLSERNALFHAAGFAPAYRSRDLSDTEMAQVGGGSPRRRPRTTPTATLGRSSRGRPDPVQSRRDDPVALQHDRPVRTAEDIALADLRIEMCFPADHATREVLMASAVG